MILIVLRIIDELRDVYMGSSVLFNADEMCGWEGFSCCREE